jgi:arylsulfatase A-like enzyme
MYKANFLLLIILMFTGCNNGNAPKNQKPNVVFILVDDLGWRDLGCYGSEFYDTPNLDEFAKEAVLFTDAYAASPVCSPTRASLMTGKHPVTVNITDWIPGQVKGIIDPQLKTPEDIHNLPLSEVTIAEAFKEKGYKTFYAGKWHLGEEPEYWPENQGFDINKGGHQNGYPPGGYYSPYNNPRLESGPEGEYLTDRLTDESLEFMRKNSKDPFFLYVAYYTVHTPIQGCEKYDEFYMDKKEELPNGGEVLTRKEHNGETRLNQSDPKYAAMVRSMDENVGRMLDYLKENNLMENTIVVFTSDNGGLTTKSQYGPTSVIPLRAGKGWCYEGGIRIPLIMKTPGIEGGTISGYPVISMDLYPTLLKLSGFPLKPEQHSDGADFSSYLENPGKSFDRTLVWHYPHYHGSTWRPGSAIRHNEWKLIEFYEDGVVELYNLKNDIEEMQDLSLKYPEKVKELNRKMHEYLKERNAQYPVRK